MTQLHHHDHCQSEDNVGISVEQHVNVLSVYIVNTAKKATPHSFQGQQLEHKSFNLVVIYILRIILATM